MAVVATQEAPIPTLCRLSVSRTEQSRNGPQNSNEELLAAFPSQSSEDHSEGEGEEETGALNLWTPASRISAIDRCVCGVLCHANTQPMCACCLEMTEVCVKLPSNIQPQYSS